MAAYSLTVSEFSRRYSCPIGQVYRRIRDGEIKAEQRGENTLIALSEAERWFATLPPDVRRRERLKLSDKDPELVEGGDAI